MNAKAARKRTDLSTLYMYSVAMLCVCGAVIELSAKVTASDVR